LQNQRPAAAVPVLAAAVDRIGAESRLSRSERDVLLQRVLHRTPQEIQVERGITYETYKDTKRRILWKLELESLEEACARVMRRAGEG
jgi:DNA-binding CsgD family transcriptional regulator